ncbi:hypothetical protein [Virgibacillus ainsalahensis]
MAFGVNRKELKEWKKNVENGHIAFLTHYWLDDRFPGCDTVTKVGCNDIKKLQAWGETYGLQPSWIHLDEKHPHFDLFGVHQKEILKREGQLDQMQRFKIK